MTPTCPITGRTLSMAKAFRRKVVRDLTGQTGFKLIAGILRGGLVHFGGRSSDGKSLLLKQVGVQAALAGYFDAAGHWLDLVALVCEPDDVLHAGGATATDRGARGSARCGRTPTPVSIPARLKRQCGSVF